MNTAFERNCKELTGFSPFPWQRRLHEAFLRNEIPPVCDIPTGLGKTMVIPLWLLALADNPRLPRRLVYVVNRRTIVDQATDLVCSMRKAMIGALNDPSASLHGIACMLQGMDPLASDKSTPFGVSTLRGEFADNEEWKTNPAKPAIVIGTVDMIGSKLLFSGYGDSRRTRPLHAGLLGCDCLYVHDEAHLTPAFGQLLRAIQTFGANGSEASGQDHGWFPGMRVLELSATHTEATATGIRPFTLEPEDETDETIRRRMAAPKTLHLHRVDKDGAPLQDRIVELAKAYESRKCRVVVFLRRPDDAQKVANGIRKALSASAIAAWEEEHPGQNLSKKKREGLSEIVAQRVSILTGQIRGHERDLLLRRPAMQPFLGETLPGQAVYLVATSAAEVGMDLHADHMVGDLSTLDSMVQRLGRVNRFGQDDAEIQVVHEKEIQKEAPRLATLELLKKKGGASNGADVSLLSLREWLQEETARVAFTPIPEMVELTTILLDLWAQTSADDIAASPEPEPWLHGIQVNYPHTTLAWRDEIKHLQSLADDDVRRWFNGHPLRAPERLQLPTHVITKLDQDKKSSLFKDLPAEKHDAPAIIISAHGDIKKATLRELITSPRSFGLNYATIIFASEIGGLDDAGFFLPKTKTPTAQIDTASDEMQRCVLTRNGEAWNYIILGEHKEPVTSDSAWKRLPIALGQLERRTGLKVILRLQVQVADEFTDENEAVEKWLLLLAPPKGRQKQTSTHIPTVDEHNADVAEVTERLCKALGLLEGIRDAMTLAAEYHDTGKNSPRWQTAAGHDPVPTEAPLAKGIVDWRKLDGYRHEAGSMMAAFEAKQIQQHPEKDLILHLISTHHGWARPHFKANGFPSGMNDGTSQDMAYEIMLRYDRLQRRFGWWGLAWLESILRRADAIASATEQPGTLEDES